MCGTRDEDERLYSERRLGVNVEETSSQGPNVGPKARGQNFKCSWVFPYAYTVYKWVFCPQVHVSLV